MPGRPFGRGRHKPAQAADTGMTLCRSPVMKGHEDDGNVLWKRSKHFQGNPGAFNRILRKEVIQPQVPLRLPCYDFTPVADPTVAGCLPCGLAHHLRVKPTPMA